MGSDSDFPVMKKAIAIFKEFGVEYEVLLASAHRTPAAVREFVSTAEERGISAFVVGAGMAAHLPGVVASYTTLPVIGVPLESGSLQGMDALLAIVQMPSGIPVATVAIDGAKNAAILAIQIMAVADAGLAEKLRAARDEGTAAVLKERSPACGSGEIYDGTFTHTVVDGFGVAAELLAENGIRVLGESELEAFLRE